MNTLLVNIFSHLLYGNCVVDADTQEVYFMKEDSCVMYKLRKVVDKERKISYKRDLKLSEFCEKFTQDPYEKWLLPCMNIDQFVDWRRMNGSKDSKEKGEKGES